MRNRKKLPFDVVCFDCDSTLSRIEGIDALAERAGVAEQIAPLTTAAMNGEIAIDEVYARRVELVRPDRRALRWLGDLYSRTTVPGVQQTIAFLQAAGVDVHIVSGGLREAILILAARIGVPDQNVHAVGVHVSADGVYVGFESQSALTRSDGKAEICRKLAAGGRRVALVGDGMTDMAARAAGTFVVGYGGVTKRDAVQQAADAYIFDEDLRAVLPFVLPEAP